MLVLLFLSVTSSLCCDLKPLQRVDVTSATSSQVRVSWSAPADADIACVQGYKVCAGSRGQAAPACTSIRNPHIGGYVIAGLLPCGQYNVSVAALAAGGSESLATAILASTAPHPAANLVVVRTEAPARIVASWTYDAAVDSCARQFKLTWCRGKGSAAVCNVARIPAVASAAYSQDLLHVQYCGEYDVGLAVLDEKQRGSDALRTTIPSLPIRGPENLTVTNYTSSSVEVHWDIPERQLTCDYHVFVNVAFTERSSQKSVQTTFDAGRTSYVINATGPCKAYAITVGFGTAMEKQNASTVAYTLPKENEIFSNISIKQVTSSSVTVAWTSILESYECITSYHVCWRKDNNTYHCNNTTADSFEITALQPHTNYQVSVEARLGNGFPLDSRILAATTTSGAAGFFSTSMAKMFVIVSFLEYITNKHSYEAILS